ncbi:ribbon-helix-helix protein, CopG family [Agromyces sp. NPDC058484]|uniref:ribbon-helix-helix protein, CopG family n=1 Tax=Agromyces sp. NPDC058484 TaxID=3346524 RepID=UPI003662B0BF
MATLERRVQVLFDAERYAELEAEAAASRQSVGALIREAVDDRLARRRRTAREALAELWASADARPTRGAIDWSAEKGDFERESLRNLP